MKQKNYSVTSMWDKRAMNVKTKQSRIMLSVIINSKQFRITLNLKSTKADYNKAISSSRILSDEAKSVRKDLNDYLLKAEKILERLDNPNQEIFTRLFKSETDLFSNNKTEISPFFQHKISTLFTKERFSTSSGYDLTLKSLCKYKPTGVIHFEDVDDKFLKGYVQWMISQGNSITTAYIYLRNLRTIFNEAIKDGIISQNHYPFKGISIASNVKSKEALYPQQLKELLLFKTKGIGETKAKAYFFFCYLSNGMNFRDAALLQFKNINGDMLTFIRHKTKNTTKSGPKEIKVYLHDLAKKIIEEYGNKSTNPDDYIFPLINKNMTALEVQNKISVSKRVTNKSLSKIGRELKFPVHLCLNLARHSYATKMKIDNISTSIISDALGHASAATTAHYLKSLPNEQLKTMSNSLLLFDK